MTFSQLLNNNKAKNPQKNLGDSSRANVINNGKRGRRRRGGGTTKKRQFEPETRRAAEAVYTREKVIFHSFRASNAEFVALASPSPLSLSSPTATKSEWGRGSR